MRSKSATPLAAAIAVTIGIGAFYSALIAPYWVRPRQDQQFLESKPTESDILKHFGSPDEQIRSGEHFKPSGWYPLPAQAASYAGYSYTRRNGDKLYIFISTNRTLESYAIGRS